jgi:hypothetical protein
MPVNDLQLAELRQAYQVLGIPPESSALSIKQSYRRLVKRWHPDLYPNGTSAHVKATHMTRLINEAYSAIAHAPLRYHIETYPHKTTGRGEQTSSPSANAGTTTTTERIPKTDRLEFWVRFVCGGLFGIFVCLDIVFSDMAGVSHYSVALALGALGIILGSGFAAARFGDKFWHSIVRRWLLWW